MICHNRLTPHWDCLQITLSVKCPISAADDLNNQNDLNNLAVWAVKEDRVHVCAFTKTNVKSLESLEAWGNTTTSTLCMTRRLSQSTVLTVWASHRHQTPPGDWPHQHHQQGKQDPGSIEKNPENRLLFSERQVLQGIHQTSTGICKLSLGPKQHQAD